MDNKFLTVDDIMLLLQIKKSRAYKLIQKLNAELAEKGYQTIPGRIPRTYFELRMGCMESGK